MQLVQQTSFNPASSRQASTLSFAKMSSCRTTIWLTSWNCCLRVAILITAVKVNQQNWVCVFLFWFLKRVAACIVTRCWWSCALVRIRPRPFKLPLQYVTALPLFLWNIPTTRSSSPQQQHSWHRHLGDHNLLFSEQRSWYWSQQWLIPGSFISVCLHPFFLTNLSL